MVGGNDGVQGHTETLWRLLARRGIPTFVFVNKTDLLPDGGSAEERARVIAQLRARLSEGCVPADDLAGEAAAMTDDAALDEYLEAGSLAPGTIRRLVAQRRAFPVFFGSALKNDGVEGLLDGLAELVEEREWPREFAARVYRVSHGRKGERVAWLKVTGGALCAKQVVSGVRAGEPWSQKVDQLRVAVGARLEPVGEVRAGRLCAVTGLTRVRPGDGLGAESDAEAPVLAPVLTYRVLTGDEDAHAVLAALRELACEDPMLGVAWSERLQEIHLQLMGAVQLEVVRGLLSDRYGLSVDFGSAGILYKETLSAPSMGIGHFEPLRHYAEAHLLVEPGPRGGRRRLWHALLGRRARPELAAAHPRERDGARPRGRAHGRAADRRANHAVRRARARQAHRGRRLQAGHLPGGAAGAHVRPVARRVRAAGAVVRLRAGGP